MSTRTSRFVTVEEIAAGTGRSKQSIITMASRHGWRKSRRGRKTLYALVDVRASLDPTRALRRRHVRKWAAAAGVQPLREEAPRV